MIGGGEVAGRGGGEERECIGGEGWRGGYDGDGERAQSKGQTRLGSVGRGVQQEENGVGRVGRVEYGRGVNGGDMSGNGGVCGVGEGSGVVGRRETGEERAGGGEIEG